MFTHLNKPLPWLQGRCFPAVVCCILRWHEQLVSVLNSLLLSLSMHFAVGWQFSNLYRLIIVCWILHLHILDPKPVNIFMAHLPALLIFTFMQSISWHII